MTSNIIQLDPVQGLVDYIEDIKPYHTKVVEILTEYVYNEAVDITIREDFHLEIGLFFGGTPGVFSIGEEIITLGGWGGSTPWDGFTSWPVIPPSITLAGGPFVDAPLGYDIGTDTVMISGDRTDQYVIGLSITIDLYAFDTVLDTRTVGDQTSYTIVDVEYVSFGQINGVAITPHTVLTVTALNNPVTTLPALGGDEVYAAGVNLDPFTIDSVVGYSNASPVFYTDVPPGADPLPTPTIGSLPQSPDENPGALIFSNSFVINGDFEIGFPQGYKFEVVGGTTEGLYTTKYAYYDIGVDKTYIRVIEEVNTVAFVTGDIQERFFGYDESFIDQTNIPVGLTATELVERLVFSWSDPAENDVIEGFQFFVKQATNGTSVFQVNGDATDDIFDTDAIQVVGSPSNDLVYTVNGAPTFDGQFTDITVIGVLVTEKGGWVEKYVP